jgi:DNA-binding protein
LAALLPNISSFWQSDSQSHDIITYEKIYHNVFIELTKSLESLLKKKTRSEAVKMAENNSVLIGRKPVMNYVLACISLFHGGANEISVKARGRAITRAVDVVEVTRRRFMPDLKVKKVGIGTDQLAPFEEGGTPSNVSTIEITLAK